MAKKKNTANAESRELEVHDTITEQPKAGSLKTADQTAEPVGLDEADPNDAPVRTNDPQQPILGSLAVGAGEHRPPDPDVYDADGRRKQAAEAHVES